jgi:dTDP-4-dehydrorhamnose 3,5-epimerase
MSAGSLITQTELFPVLLVHPKRFGDARGWFSETYNREAFAAAGLDIDFVQDNESESAEAGTVRGLHFQSAPHAQTKLVRVINGAILDVAVDIRPDSPTYGRHVAVELSAEDPTQLLIPAGFAHGFCTLKPNTRVAYKVNALYAPSHDHGILWNDPELAIAWPVGADSAILSAKDKIHPTLRAIQHILLKADR